MTTAPRLISRAAGLLALALAAVTCSDGPTAPASSRAAHVALTPSLSASAMRSYAALAQLGFDIASAHVRLTAGDGRVAADTIVPFPATKDTLRLDLSVTVRGGEESFMASIELRDAAGLVLFAGTRLVTARAIDLASGSPAPFVLEYAGPGRDARTLVLTPASGAVPASGVVLLSATGFDSAGHPVGDLLVRWSTSDSALAGVAALGTATAELRGAGKRGTVVVGAVTPTGLSASTTLALVPSPARLVVRGGDGQSVRAGRTLAEPFAIEVQAQDGGPVPGITVQFRAVTAGGTVSAASAISDASGLASTDIGVGRRAGEYSFEAASGALAPVSVVATAIAAPPAAITITSGAGQRATVGDPLGAPLVVRVTDELGEPADGATVGWSVIAGDGQLDAAQSTTDADGRASVSYVLGRYAGSQRVRASLLGVAEASVEFEVAGDAGDAAGFRVLQLLPNTIRVGVPPATALRVQLVDNASNSVSQAGVVVTATGVVSPGNRPPFVLSATSDGYGIATITLPAYVGALGNATITLTSPGLTTLALPPIAFVTGPPATLRVTTQPSAATWSGALLPVQPVVTAADAGANSVSTAGIAVTAFIASGGGTLNGTTTVLTDTTGAASFSDLIISGSPGQRTLGFSSQSLTDVLSGAIDVVASPVALAPVADALAPATTTSGATLSTFALQLVDGSGQPVARAGVPITVAATSLVSSTPPGALVGTLTRLTDATGMATFDDVAFNAPPGDYALTASSDPAVLALPVLTLVASLTVN